MIVKVLLPGMPQTHFFVITGPSGAGKDTVIEGLRKKIPSITSVVTTTTRPMREGESEGNPYHFISRGEFEKKLSAGEFLEWATVYGNYYGSEKREIERLRSLGVLAVFKIDIQGARTMKKTMPEIFAIFIAPPDHETLVRRMRERGKDSPEAMERRIETAKQEMADVSEWDAVVVNEEDRLSQTIDRVRQIIQSKLSL